MKTGEIAAKSILVPSKLPDEHRCALDAIVRDLLDRRGLSLRRQSVLRHSTPRL